MKQPEAEEPDDAAVAGHFQCVVADASWRLCSGKFKSAPGLQLPGRASFF